MLPATPHPRADRSHLDPLPSGARQIASRLAANTGWLLGGRGFTAVASIGYLALASRALGLERFGVFSLILAYGGTIAALAQFKSWQAVIRYGALHLADGRPDRLARLVGFTATVDWLSALAGVALAAVAVPLVGPWLGWTIEQQWGAALFSAVLLVTTGATASGVLRLFNRYDLLSAAEAAGPAVRLGGAAAAWWAGGGLAAFLSVWALAAALETGAQWAAVLWLGRTRIAFGRAAFRAAAVENARVWPFMVQNSFAASLSLLGERAGTLVVGAVGGPVVAGGFRVASKLAGGIGKLADTVTRALFPELVRLAASDDRELLRRVAARTTAIACAVAVAVVAVVWAVGPALLGLVFGSAFEFARDDLLLLTVAAAIDLVGLAFEPILNAHGRSGRVLGARALGAVAYLGALAALLPLVGTLAAAVAAVAMAATIRAVLALSCLGLLRAGNGAGAEGRGAV